MKGLDTVESLSGSARGSIFFLLKVLPKLGLLYDVDKFSTIPTVYYGNTGCGIFKRGIQN